MKEQVVNFIECAIRHSDGITENGMVEIFRSLPHLMLESKPMFDRNDVKLIRRTIGFFYTYSFGSFVFNMIKELICEDDEVSRYIPINVFDSIAGLQYLSEVCSTLNIDIRITTNDDVCFIELSNRNRI